MGQRRLRRLAMGHIVAASPHLPKLVRAWAATLPWQGTPYTPLLCSLEDSCGLGVMVAPPSSLGEHQSGLPTCLVPPVWCLGRPLALVHAHGEPLHQPRPRRPPAILATQLPGSAWVAQLQAVVDTALALHLQRLRGKGLSCWGRSGWGPQAEPIRAGSSSTWLVLLALPPRAAQGERFCWGPALHHNLAQLGRFHGALNSSPSGVLHGRLWGRVDVLLWFSLTVLCPAPLPV